MEIAGVIERVEHIATVRSSGAVDAGLLASGLVAIREVRAWCDAQHAGMVSSLQVIDSFAEKTIADAARQSLGQASKTPHRELTLTLPNGTVHTTSPPGRSNRRSVA